jgi:hypothetical protein
MIEAKHFQRFIMPSTYELRQAITDTITQNLATDSSNLHLKPRLDKAMDAGIGTYSYTTQLALTRDGPGGDGTLSLLAWRTTR